MKRMNGPGRQRQMSGSSTRIIGPGGITVLPGGRKSAAPSGDPGVVNDSRCGAVILIAARMNTGSMPERIRSCGQMYCIIGSSKNARANACAAGSMSARSNRRGAAMPAPGSTGEFP